MRMEMRQIMMWEFPEEPSATAQNGFDEYENQTQVRRRHKDSRAIMEADCEWPLELESRLQQDVRC